MPGGSPAAWPHVKDIFQSDRRQGRGRRALLRLGGRKRRRPLREDGPQRHRIRRHAAHLRGLQPHEDRPRPERRRRCTRSSPSGTRASSTPTWSRSPATSWPSKTPTAQPLVDKILDAAGQKGTGKWTVISSLDLGIPITLIAEAVYSRCVSALKEERVAAAKKLKGPEPAIRGRPEGSSSKTSARRSTPRRSSPTRKATCSCARRPRNTTGTSTTAASP